MNINEELLEKEARHYVKILGYYLRLMLHYFGTKLDLLRDYINHEKVDIESVQHTEYKIIGFFFILTGIVFLINVEEWVSPEFTIYFFTIVFLAGFVLFTKKS